MKVFFTAKCLVASGLALMLIACDGSSSMTGSPTPGSGIDRLGISIGAITGFGSIIVNGVRFETDSASFDVDDNASTSRQSDLAVGDIVTVTFNPANPAVALTVVGDEAVEGPVNSIDIASGEFVVAGQTVLITTDTSFDTSTGVQSLVDIQPGNFVEVSGFFGANGSIRATRIERKPASAETEVHGFVTGKTTDTFMINALLINYTSVPATVDDDFPNGTFNNGDSVEVKGSSYSGDTLLATKIEPDGIGTGEGGASSVNTANIGNAEIEGLITRFVSVADFDVAGIPVRTSSSTVFEGGTSANLGLNVKVEVEGQFNNGVLLSSKVDIRRGNDLRITALVDSIDPTANMLTLLGIEVRVDENTRLEDKSDADIVTFSFSNISVGDYLEIRGGVDTGSADILAQSLEREDVPDVPGEDTELRAIVGSINRPFLILGGVTVDTSNAQFRNIGGPTFTANEFFAAVRVGDLVDVDGFQTGRASISAEEVEFED